MHDSRIVANRFLTLAAMRNDAITPMQLLKLVYIAHGWMLGLYGRPLISDEVQAWQYGPVIPSLYNATKKFRSQPVAEQLAVRTESQLDESETDVIDQVYGLYGHLTGPALSRITHALDTPWSRTYLPGTFGIVISNDLIEDHYRRLSVQAA
jgi:uncharacterized phage-associated protein